MHVHMVTFVGGGHLSVGGWAGWAPEPLWGSAGHQGRTTDTERPTASTAHQNKLSEIQPETRFLWPNNSGGGYSYHLVFITPNFFTYMYTYVMECFSGISKTLKFSLCLCILNRSSYIILMLLAAIKTMSGLHLLSKACTCAWIQYTCTCMYLIILNGHHLY